MYDPNAKTVEVLSKWADKTWPLGDFLKLIGDAVACIPEEHRETATVELRVYDGAACLQIEYRRPETDGEMATRLQDELRLATRAEAMERVEYERLKAKFGSPTP